MRYIIIDKFICKWRPMTRRAIFLTIESDLTHSCDPMMRYPLEAR